MYIRKSTVEDYERIMEIYAHARAFMAENGNPNQWGPRCWPPGELVRQDVEENGCGYVCVAEEADIEAMRGTGSGAADEAAQHETCTASGLKEDEQKEDELKDGTVIGAFYYTYGVEDPTYINIEDGNWMDFSPYGVVHRMAGSGQLKGTGAAILNWAFEKSGHLRVDTHGDNKVLQNLLGKLGFTHCGTIYVKEDNYPRLAYEKVK